MSGVLPAAWRWATFSDVAHIAANLVDPKDFPNLPHIAPDNIERHTGRLLAYRTVQQDAVTSANHHFYPGQLLYSKIRPYLNKCVRVEFEGLCSADMYPLDPLIEPGYLHHYILTREFVSAVTKAAGSRTVLPKTNQKQLANVPVPVAPSEQQPAIVAAIESHFSRLDAATATLGRVQGNLERYRASVLKAAVEGRLVPTEAELAKKEGRSYEPASTLLKRILAERRRRWEEAELAKLKAKGKPPTDDKWKARYEEPAAPDTDALPELPEGWCWTTSESMFWDAGYGTSGKCTPDSSGPPVLRIPNVQDQALDLSDLKFAVDPGTLAPDGAVEPGDFLFIRTNGSVSLIGRGAVILDAPPRKCFFASYLIRLRLARVEGLWRWFAFAWHTSVIRDQLVRDAASSAGQHNVSLSAASRYLMPLPPAREQERILAEVDHLETGRASATHDTRVGRDRIARLRQSILKWAFEGRLVDGLSRFCDTQRQSPAHTGANGGT